jgi:hypothetical protein
VPAPVSTPSLTVAPPAADTLPPAASNQTWAQSVAASIPVKSPVVPQAPVAHRIRLRTQGGRIAVFGPRTHCLTHWTQHNPPVQLPSHSVNAVLDPSNGATLNYHQLLRGPKGPLWRQGASDE